MDYHITLGAEIQLNSGFFSLWDGFARSVPMLPLKQMNFWGTTTANFFPVYMLIAPAPSKHGITFVRTHPTNKWTPEVIYFSCELCSSSSSTEKDFFQHLGVHLRKNQTVHCVFRECDFSTNVFGSFASHRSRKHSAHSSNDFRAHIVHKNIDQSNSTNDIAEAHCSEAYECSRAHDCSGEYKPEELKEEEIREHLQCAKQVHYWGSSWAPGFIFCGVRSCHKKNCKLMFKQT